MANLKKTQRLIMQVVLGADAAPTSDITNGLKVTTDSNVDFAAGSENELTDVAGASLSPRGTITGTLAGNATVNGYLKSTDGTNEPAITPLLKMSGMSLSAGVELELSAAPSFSVRDTITGGTSSAEGVVSAIDDTTVFVTTEDTFQVGDEVETGITVTEVGSNSVYVYNPDSDSADVGSIFMHNETNVSGIKNARANITLSAESGSIPKFSVTALGPSDVANRTMTKPTITYEDSRELVFKDSDMKISWGTSNSFVPVNSSIEWNLGSAPQLVNDSVNSTGIDSVIIASRAEAGGSIVIYMEDFSDFDAQALKNEDTEFNIQYRFGNGEDSRTVYINQRVQFGQISAPSDSNGLLGLTIPLKAVGTDDDETILVFK